MSSVILVAASAAATATMIIGTVGGHDMPAWAVTAVIVLISVYLVAVWRLIK